MESTANRDASFPGSIEEGVRRVRHSTDDQPFVLVGERHTLEFHASREPCDLVVVGEGSGKQPEVNGEYRLAVRRGYSPTNVARLEAALGKIKESGELEELYTRWWTDRAQCSHEVEGSGEEVETNQGNGLLRALGHC